MQSISSSQFKQDNNIIFKAKIIKNLDIEGHITNGEMASWSNQLESKDTIDINGNGMIDRTFETAGIPLISLHSIIKTEEPTLGIPLQKIKDAAERRHTEIVTEDDIPDMTAHNLILEGHIFYGNSREIKERTLKDVAREIDPFPNKWAIDVKAEEFLLYTPKNK
jgi:hypothetical protein